MASDPTVGRIVHYYEQPTDENPRPTYAALITAVHDAENVSLAVFVPGLQWYRAEDAKLGDDIGNWNWPPRAS